MKTISFLLMLIFSLSFSFMLAQTAPGIEWQNTIGGNKYDELMSVQQTIDGGYILGGYSSSTVSGDRTEKSRGWEDYWVVKLNAAGDIEWQQAIGGDYQDFLNSIEQTSDGGYILGGNSDSGISGDKNEPDANGDIWIVKLNSFGEIEWQNTIGGDEFEWLSSIHQTTDGGYILGGTSWSGISGDKTENSRGESDYWILKLNSIGEIEWDKTLGGSEIDDGAIALQTNDDGYIVGGTSSSNISGDKTEVSQGMQDYWIVKLNKNGELEWQNTIGGNDKDFFYCIDLTSDNGYILGGSSYSGISGDKTEPSILSDYWVVKLNAMGEIEWENTVGGDGYDGLFAIQQTEDGYILGGESPSDISGDKTEESRGTYDCWIVKLSSDGDVIWDKTFGGDSLDYLFAMQQTIDGGYLLGAMSYSGISDDKTEVSQGASDYWVIKTEPEIHPTNCETPIETIASNIQATAATLSWSASSDVTGYSVVYKIKGTSDWLSAPSKSSSKKLKGLFPSTEYAWKVKSLCDISPLVSSDWCATQNFTTKPLKLEGEDAHEISLEVFPNPFSSTATISFSLMEDSHVLTELFSVDGKKVMTIADENFSEGNHEIDFSSQSVSPGIYFVELKAEKEIITQKVVVE